MTEVAAAVPATTEPAADVTAPKHKLQNRWTFWFLNPKAASEKDWYEKVKQFPWHELLENVYTFDSVEDFWALFNSIIPPSRLKQNGEFYLFKESVLPSKESNPGLGIWQCNLPRDWDKKKLEDNWLALVLGMVGETLEDADDILGAIVTIRRSGPRLSLWTKSGSNMELQKRIEQRVRATLELPDEVQWEMRT